MEMTLEWFCWNCHHMTHSVGAGICAWCKSPRIGTANHPAGPIPQSRRTGRFLRYEESKQPTKHQRLMEGFALLHKYE
jgi:hypothetical protein